MQLVSQAADVQSQAALCTIYGSQHMRGIIPAIRVVQSGATMRCLRILRNTLMNAREVTAQAIGRTSNAYLIGSTV